MPKCTKDRIDLGRVGRRVIEADFSGGDLSSEGGVVLLRQLDQQLGLTKAVARALGDERRSRSVVHSVQEMVAQRIFGLCMGWEDVCDHNALRNDLLMQRRPSGVISRWPARPRSAAWRRRRRPSRHGRCTRC